MNELAARTVTPLGQLATRTIAPKLGEAQPVPGPPKRFAQVTGAVVTSTIVVVVATGLTVEAQALLVVLILFAGLESILGLCVGCRIFAALMRAGLIPAETCEACEDISLLCAPLAPQT